MCWSGEVVREWRPLGMLAVVAVLGTSSALAQQPSAPPPKVGNSCLRGVLPLGANLQRSWDRPGWISEAPFG